MGVMVNQIRPLGYTDEQIGRIGLASTLISCLVKIALITKNTKVQQMQNEEKVRIALGLIKKQEIQKYKRKEEERSLASQSLFLSHFHYCTNSIFMFLFVCIYDGLVL